MNSLAALAFLIFSFCASAKEAPQSYETYGVNSDYAMPLISIKRTEEKQFLESGLLKDLGVALFKELNLTPVFVLLPKKRVAPNILSGYVNVVCHLHESWQSKIASAVHWSNTLYRASNVVVFVGRKSIHKLKDLAGERLGGVLNFIYTDAEDSFAKHIILRENGPNNESNVHKLLSSRINFIIMSNLEYEYYKKIYPILERADFEMDVLHTKCALSGKSKIKISDLNKAIATLKKNGEIERILKSYQ